MRVPQRPIEDARNPGKPGGRFCRIVYRQFAPEPWASAGRPLLECSGVFFATEHHANPVYFPRTARRQARIEDVSSLRPCAVPVLFGVDDAIAAARLSVQSLRRVA